MMFGCSFKHSCETERQFPVILLIAKFWQFSSLRHKVEQVNVSLEKKKKKITPSPELTQIRFTRISLTRIVKNFPFLA